jgi:hypothetical protein
VAHPDLRGFRNFLLATKDAHKLYRRYGGFDSLENPEKWMRRSNSSEGNPVSVDPDFMVAGTQGQ